MRKWILTGLAVVVLLGFVIYLQSGESAKEQADKQMSQFHCTGLIRTLPARMCLFLSIQLFEIFLKPLALGPILL
jgi:hypothetical protein